MPDFEREDSLPTTKTCWINRCLLHLAVVAGNPVATRFVPRHGCDSAQRFEVLPRVVDDLASQEPVGENSFGERFVNSAAGRVHVRRAAS